MSREPAAERPRPEREPVERYVPEVGFSSVGVTSGYRMATPRVEEPWDCAENPNPGYWQPRNDRELRYAQAICGGCGRKELCLKLGLTRNESGVWGGVLLSNGRIRDRVVRTGRPPRVSFDEDRPQAA